MLLFPYISPSPPLPMSISLIWKFCQHLKLNTRNLAIPLSHSSVSSMTQTTLWSNPKILWDSVSSFTLNHLPDSSNHPLVFKNDIEDFKWERRWWTTLSFLPPALTKNCSLLSEIWGGKTTAKRKRQCQRRKRWHKVCSNHLHPILTESRTKAIK